MDKSKKNDNIISIVINIGIIVVFAIFVVFVIITLLELSKKTTDVISFIGEVINKRENITTANQNENENTLLPYADMITTTKVCSGSSKRSINYVY